MLTRLSTVWQTYQIAKNYLICYRNWETENNCIQLKSFISILNARFVCEHFIHIVTKEGWYGSSAKVSFNFCSLIFKPCWTTLSTPKSEPQMKLMFKSLMQHFLFTFARFSPGNFGGIAKYLLRKILQRDRKVIHFVSDKWTTPSIKDCERQCKNATDVSYHSFGAAQKRPTNWFTALRSSSFKTSLLEFLASA